MTSANSLAQGGAPFRLCLYFALNPDEELQSSDVVTKFGIPGTSCHTVFNNAIIGGWLTRTTTGRGRNSTSIYTAGPRLLEMVGAHK